MSEQVAAVVKSLKANFFSPVEFVETGEAATKLVLGMIPADAKVGLGGSTSIIQIGLVHQLKERGTTVFDKAEPSDLPFDERRRRDLRVSDIFLASCNAVTLDGKIVDIDGTGNRVAGMVFGPKQVILVVGINKIVRNVDEAIARIKSVIAPYHCMARGRKVPCAVNLRCTDCKSPDRSCRVTVIMERKPRNTDIAVVLVGEDLGLGWDPDWTEERKNRIASVYRKFVTDVF